MQQTESEILKRTEAIASEHLADLVSQFSDRNYGNYLKKKLLILWKQGQEVISLDLAHSSLHYKNPLGEPRLQYFHQDKKILTTWEKLCTLGESFHLAKTIQSDTYTGEEEIHVLIGREEKGKYINIPYDIAKKLSKWIKDDLPKIPNEELNNRFEKLKNDLNENLEKIANTLKSITKNDLISPDVTLRTLLLSLHLTLYYLENRFYHCFYSKITDGKYILGSFAGRFEKINNDDIMNIKYFSKGLLSYITYWEGIANYEKNYTKLKPVNWKIKNKVKNIFNDYFHKELIFLDPKKTIEGALIFEDTFQSERTSHKTGKKQQILVVRLFVRSQDAFRFLYCDGAANYIKIEKYLENIIKQNSDFNRVRLDVAIADTIPRFDTLYTETTRLFNVEDAVRQKKIKQKGIIYKFYNKYQNLLS